MKSLEHRLMVYKARLKDQITEEQIDFYLDEITQMENELEAEVAVEGLKEDCKLIPPWEVVTDDKNTVKDLIGNSKVVDVDRVWSWRFMKYMFVVKFYHKIV